MFKGVIWGECAIRQGRYTEHSVTQRSKPRHLTWRESRDVMPTSSTVTDLSGMTSLNYVILTLARRLKIQLISKLQTMIWPTFRHFWPSLSNRFHIVGRAEFSTASRLRFTVYTRGDSELICSYTVQSVNTQTRDDYQQMGLILSRPF